MGPARSARVVYSADLITPNSIALTPDGDVYVAGYANRGLPLRFPLQQFPSRSPLTGFLMKLSGIDGNVLYSTYFGGTTGVSRITGIAVDDSGGVYLAGSSGSADFPNTPGLPGITQRSPESFDQHALSRRFPPLGTALSRREPSLPRIPTLPPCLAIQEASVWISMETRTW
jgi:sugar lactone lactonase YvrE